MKIAVIIPTYNEEANIGRLLPILFDEFKQMSNHNFVVIIVDGNSSDKTQEIVKTYSQIHNNLLLISEKEKSGLGGAYTVGFKSAINEVNADVIVEMDADFQHNPHDVKRLVGEIDLGSDCVIGSRFVKGGSIPRQWAFYRKFLSLGGSLFIKFVLCIFDVHDFTSGFRATKVKGVLDKVDFDQILSKGFAYKIELLYKIKKLGAKIKEVPIVFGLRDRGDSKMERNNLLDSIRVVCLIRYGESQSFFKFLGVGFAGLGVDFGLFNLLRLILLPSRFASILSGFIAMVVTFSLNNAWSFKEQKILGFGKQFRTFIIFSLSSVVPILFRSFLIAFAVRSFADTFVVANLAFFVGILAGLVWNFTVYSKIIWKKRLEGK